MKQSPIEWMEDQLKQVLPINQMNDIVIQDLFKKAKEKEKSNVKAQKIAIEHFRKQRDEGLLEQSNNIGILSEALQQIATGEIVGESKNYKDSLYIVKEIAKEALEKMISEKAKQVDEDPIIEITEIETLDNHKIKESDGFWSVIRKVNDFLRIEPIYFEKRDQYNQGVQVFKYKKNAKIYCKAYNSAIDNAFTMCDASRYALEELKKTIKQ